MRIVEEQVKLPVAETRKTGKAFRKVYYLEHRNRRVGPYHRLVEARVARDRALESVRKLRSRQVAA